MVFKRWPLNKGFTIGYNLTISTVSNCPMFTVVCNHVNIVFFSSSDWNAHLKYLWVPLCLILWQATLHCSSWPLQDFFITHHSYQGQRRLSNITDYQTFDDFKETQPCQLSIGILMCKLISLNYSSQYPSLSCPTLCVTCPARKQIQTCHKCDKNNNAIFKCFQQLSAFVLSMVGLHVTIHHSDNYGMWLTSSIEGLYVTVSAITCRHSSNFV